MSLSLAVTIRMASRTPAALIGAGEGPFSSSRATARSSRSAALFYMQFPDGILLMLRTLQAA
jgi:hypothetical protein